MRNQNNSVNSFTEGMDQDTSVNKYSNNSYYDAEDLRIITKDSLTNGAMTNFNGTSLFAELPNIGEKVLSHCAIADDIYLFTNTPRITDLDIVYTLVVGEELIVSFDYKSYKFKIISSEEPDDPEYLGYIYTSDGNQDLSAELNRHSELVDYFYIYVDDKVKFVPRFSYNAGFTTPTGILSSTDESNSSILKVIKSSQNTNLILNDSSFNNKLNFSSETNIVGRLEAEGISKLYFSNGIDPLRSLNIDSDKTITDASQLDHIPDVDFSTLNITTKIIGGGKLNGGKYQYAYQLINKNNSSTSFSPLSSEVVISGSNLNIGVDAGDSSNQAVFISVDNINSSYDIIRIVSIAYEYYDQIPSINIVAEVSIDDLNSVTAVDNGEYIGSVSLEEFRTFSQTTISPDILESKDNILFIGNTNEVSFSSDVVKNWDSRVYMFDGHDGEAMVYDHPSSLSINDNAYTIQNNGSWTHTSGSSGSNWSIPDNANCFNRGNELFENDLAASEYWYNPDYEVSDISSNIAGDSTGVFGALGKNISITFIPSIGNYIGSYGYKEFIQYQADEIYRFGIVFLNNKGQYSFAKWIADIRWPSISQGFINGFQRLHYALDVSLINEPDDNDIVGYKIIRVKRSSVDVSIETCGLLQPIVLGRSFIADNQQLLNVKNIIDSEVTYGSNPITTAGITSSILEFISPESKFNNPDVSNYIGSKLILSHISESPDLDESTGGGNFQFEAEFNSVKHISEYEDVAFEVDQSSYEITESIYTNTSHKEADVISSTELIRSVNFTNQGYIQTTAPSESFTYYNGYASRCSGSLIALDTDLKLDYLSNSFSRMMLIFDSTSGTEINVGDIFSIEVSGSAIGGDITAIETCVSGTPSQYEFQQTGAGWQADIGELGEAMANDYNFSYTSTVPEITGNLPVTISRDYDSVSGDYMLIFEATDIGVEFNVNSVPSYVSSFINQEIDPSDLYLFGYIVNDRDISRYGGYSHNAKQFNEFVDASDIESLSSNGVVTIGDVYFNEFNLYRFLYYNALFSDVDDSVSESRRSFKQLLSLRTSSRINTINRSDDITSNYQDMSDVSSNDGWDRPFTQETVEEGIRLFPESYNEKIGDLYRYNNVYSRDLDVKIYIPLPDGFDNSFKSSVKIIASEVKINGETEDSWLNFKSNNFIEVDGQYGELIELINFKNNMFFFQENGIGQLSINQRSLIQDDNIGELSLGTGGVLDRYDYLSSFLGIKSKSDAIFTKSKLYFIDEDSSAFYSLDNLNVSISKQNGLSSFFNDNVIKYGSRLMGFDPEFNELLITTNDKTICFNEDIGKFTSMYNINPDYYIGTPDLLASHKIDHDGNKIAVNNIYLHNDGDKGSWYSEIYGSINSTSKITLIINPNGVLVNSFDTLEFRTDVFLNDENIPSNTDIYNETISRSTYQNSYINPITVEFNNLGQYSMRGSWVENGDTITVTSGESYGLYVGQSVFGSGLGTSGYNIITEIVSNGIIKLQDTVITSGTNETFTFDQKTFSPNAKIKRLARAWRTQVPLTENSNRFTDTYLMVTLEFDNNNDKLFKIHDVISHFRQSNK